MSKHRKRTKLHGGLPAEKIDWDKVAWDVVLCHAPKQAGLSTAESLHPSLKTIERSIFGRGEAREAAQAIIAAWRPDFSGLIRQVAQ